MTKKNPDKREQKRLYKIEVKKQSLRLRAAELTIDGYSTREAGELLNMSHQFVADWSKILLICTVVRKKGKLVKKYRFRKGIKKLLESKKPGPAPGNCPVRKRIKESVAAVKKKYPKLGARKIGILAGADASWPTVYKALEESGFGPVIKPKGRKYKTFCMERSNDMWQIDYVELGRDRVTGAAVSFLSIMDDHSRKVLSANVSTTATTDEVLAIMEETITIYGKPAAILSDHGTQWYSVSGGTSRFDVRCEEKGIDHIMGAIRKPTTQGKVERWHGSIRREAGLPECASTDQYLELMDKFVCFYNSLRPHHSIGLKTPDWAYSEGFGT